MKICITLPLLFVAASATAQVYTCTDPQTGRVIYSNYPGCTVTSVGQPAPVQVIQPTMQGQSTPQSAPVAPVLQTVPPITPQSVQPAIQQAQPQPLVIPAPSLLGPIFQMLKWPLIFMAILGMLKVMIPNKRERMRRRGRKSPRWQPTHMVRQPKLEPELIVRQAERKTPDYGNARFCLKRHSLLTEREQGCYWRLVEHLAPDFIVFAQVSFSQILSTKGGTGEQNYALFGTMSQKVADFVVCRKDLSMVAVIELDDSSHRGKEEQDKKRDAAVRQAGLLAFRLPNTPGNEPVKNLADVLRRMYLGADFVSSNTGRDQSPAAKETR